MRTVTLSKPIQNVDGSAITEITVKPFGIGAVEGVKLSLRSEGENYQLETDLGAMVQVTQNLTDLPKYVVSQLGLQDFMAIMGDDMGEFSEFLQIGDR